MAKFISPIVYFVAGVLVIGGYYVSILGSYQLISLPNPTTSFYISKIIEALIIMTFLYWVNVLLYRIEKNNEYRFRDHFRQSILFYILPLAAFAYMFTSGPYGLEIFALLTIIGFIILVVITCIVANAAFILSNILLAPASSLSRGFKGIITFIVIAVSVILVPIAVLAVSRLLMS